VIVLPVGRRGLDHVLPAGRVMHPIPRFPAHECLDVEQWIAVACWLSVLSTSKFAPAMRRVFRAEISVASLTIVNLGMALIVVEYLRW